MGERRQVIEHPDEGEGLSAIAKAITECFSVEKIEEMIAEERPHSNSKRQINDASDTSSRHTAPTGNTATRSLRTGCKVGFRKSTDPSDPHHPLSAKPVFRPLPVRAAPDGGAISTQLAIW